MLFGLTWGNAGFCSQIFSVVKRQANTFRNAVARQKLALRQNQKENVFTYMRSLQFNTKPLTGT